MRCFWPAIIALLFSQPAQASETLTWAVNDSPPFFILDGPYQGRGFCDVLVNVLKETLSEYQHQVRQLPQPRIKKLRQEGAPVCFPCMIKKPDHLETLYSDPTNRYVPHHIITNDEAYQRIIDRYGNQVSLAKLLQDKDFTFGHPLGRKYGEDLQPLIDKYSYQRKDHLILSASEVTRSVLKLVHMGRLDYNIDYPAVGRYFELVEQKSLRYLSIAENQDNVIIGAVGCSNTAWGQRAIEAINRVMPMVRSHSAYRESLDFWLVEPASVNSQSGH